MAQWVHANPSISAMPAASVYQEPFRPSSTSFIFGELLFILRDYLRRGGPIEDVNVDLLESCWADIASLVAKPKTTSVCLVLGVSPTEPIEFGVHGTLRPLTKERKTELFRFHTWDFGQCPVEEAAAAGAELVLPAGSGEATSRHVTIVMTAIRLMTSPRIYCRGPITIPVTDRVPVAFSYTPQTDFATPLRESHEWALILRDKDLSVGPDDLKERHALCDALDKKAFDLFHVAFHRFNQAMRRTHVEDRIIDLAISLESTVLAGISTELSWRARMLGTELLRGSVPHAHARMMLDCLYKARSKIVHEGALLSDVVASKSETGKALRKLATTVDAFDDAMVTLLQAVMHAVSYRASECDTPPDLPTRLEDDLLSGRSAARGTA